MVVAEVDDDSAWEEPIQVEKAKEASLSIPATRSKGHFSGKTP